MNDDERAAKRPKRTYRACYPCRSRKLKCSFGDPNMPWDGPCERCMRESRDCLRAKPTFVRDAPPRKTDSGELVARKLSHAPQPPESNPVPVPTFNRPYEQYSETSKVPSPQLQRRNSNRDDSSDEEGDTLVSSNLQNPSDALKLLASASSLQYRAPGQRSSRAKPTKSDQPGQGHNAATWCQWAPIQQGCLSVQDARVLFSFFELEMAPLYPLIHPTVFESQYHETLVKQEALLLGAMIVIAARYSNVMAGNRGQVVHGKLSQWVRHRILGVLNGDPSLRNISTVEALLLLCEWPMLPMPNQPDYDQGDDPTSEFATLLKPSIQYDAYSWTMIGLAVRLAQELGIQDIDTLSVDSESDNSLKQTRMLKTWIYCYNADRHISIRLGRNAVMQEAMTSRWWEAVSVLVANEGEGRADVYTSDAFLLGSIAQNLGAIQDHLYPNKEVTRSLLRTGAWESFMRSLRLELRYKRHGCREKLSEDTIDSALLRIELDYTVLYGYSLALRALQGKLKRRRQAKDKHYIMPTLLNMVEGPWIVEALSAARSIIEITLRVLEGRGMLRCCPSRIFQYILFATTFLYKAMAAGMVEHGQQNVVGMLDQVVNALNAAAIDDEHFLRGFAGLLKRLGKHWRSGHTSDSVSALTEPAARPENASHDFESTTAGVGEVPASNASDTSGNFGLNALLQVPEASSSVSQSVGSAPLFTPPDVVAGGAGADEFDWNFDPMFQMPAADHEQDILFQSIWGNTQDATASTTSNLYATLLGDTLGFESV